MDRQQLDHALMTTENGVDTGMMCGSRFWTGIAVLYVRNDASLRKPKTTRQIKAIVEATPRNAANDMIVVNANAYTRERRDNLLRMYQCVSEPDAEADEIVLEVARRLKTLWLMRDLFAPAPLSRSRVFQACHRLIARKQMYANMDQLLWEHSRIRMIA